jgi:hypothetical protein
MARQQSKAQKKTVARVMHEYKHGELKAGGRGPKVANPKQAIAIALREAGASNRQGKTKNRTSLARTTSKERRGDTAKARAKGGRSKAELMAQARRRGIAGRSRMSKADLERALAP